MGDGHVLEPTPGSVILIGLNGSQIGCLEPHRDDFFMPVVQRREKLRRLVHRTGADAILVTNFVNVTYLTGFTGDDSYLLVTRDKEILLTDGRYTVQLSEECPNLDLEIRSPGVSITKTIERVTKKAKIGCLAVEANSMTMGLAQRIEEQLPRVTLLPTDGLVEQLRVIKDRGEVEATRWAIKVAERAFSVVRAGLRTDQTEREVANLLEQQIRLFGGKCCSFPPIVAVGPRAALPHATPTDRLIGEADFVLIDWGAVGPLYMSDLTRVLVTGKISPKLRRIYRVVLKAQRRAIAAVKPGRTMQEIDAVARKVIDKEGFGKHFDHALGHGIGLEIHESPRLAPGQKQLLRPGMIVTVEPGIYLPKWGGVRIEDDVLVTKSGHEVLTSVGKELDDCVVR